jgi:redox-sensitive bicupin YhaK (pirin superfamily)
VLIVNNHDTIAPGSGFETHPHRNMEIVTWVLNGSLVHQDSEGHTGVIYPNLAQRMTAGTGIRHSEKNDRPAVNLDAGRPLDLIQMWVVPDEPEVAPGYEQLELDPADLQGRLAVVASGMTAGAGTLPDGHGGRASFDQGLMIIVVDLIVQVNQGRPGIASLVTYPPEVGSYEICGHNRPVRSPGADDQT